MNRRAVPVMVALGLILLVLAGFFGIRFLERYIPSSEQADLTEVLGVTGDEVAVYFNENLQETKGLFTEGQTYLPISWINENLNERFYWDSNEKLLVYTLPDSIVYADQNTKGSSGKSLILEKGDTVYLSLGLIANYTDAEFTAYDSAVNKRVFINNNWTDKERATVVKDGNVRIKGGVRSPIATHVNEGSKVTVLDSMNKWDKIRTEDGSIGYVER